MKFYGRIGAWAVATALVAIAWACMFMRTYEIDFITALLAAKWWILGFSIAVAVALSINRGK
jgi:hypothetical protein